MNYCILTNTWLLKWYLPQIDSLGFINQGLTLFEYPIVDEHICGYPLVDDVDVDGVDDDDDIHNVYDHSTRCFDAQKKSCVGLVDVRRPTLLLSPFECLICSLLVTC